MVTQLLEVGVDALVQVLGAHPRPGPSQVGVEGPGHDREVVGPEHAQSGIRLEQPPVGERGRQG